MNTITWSKPWEQHGYWYMNAQNFPSGLVRALSEHPLINDSVYNSHSRRLDIQLDSRMVKKIGIEQCRHWITEDFAYIGSCVLARSIWFPFIEDITKRQDS